MNPAPPDLSGRRVLVAGGTGFIGGRLIETLVQQCGAEVRVLVSNLSRVSRIARYPVELIQGDVTDNDVVQRAVEGCDIIYNFACTLFGSPARQRAVTVEGNNNILRAAGKTGASRVVFMSTISVYGPTPDGDLDETAARAVVDDEYAAAKLEAENATLRAKEDHGVAGTVIQPTVVYGPFSASWTMRVIGELDRGGFIVVDGGDGLCNAVYIDDLVSALLAAAVRDEAVGEAFLISGEEPVTWREFYGRHEKMLGKPCTVSLSMAEALEHFAEFKRKQQRRGLLREMFSILRHEPGVRRRVAATVEVDALRKFARVVVPKMFRRGARATITGQNGKAPATADTPTEIAVQPMGPKQLEFHKQKTRVRVDKAKRLLGYQPAFDFEAGMKVTEQWAAWAGLIPERETANATE